MLDEVGRLVVVTGSELFDAVARAPILQILEAAERERVDLNRVVDDELHPRQADATNGQPPPAEGSLGGREVDHDADRRLRELVEIDLAFLEVEPTVVDPTLLALGAGDRDQLPVLQSSRNPPRSAPRMATGDPHLSDLRAAHGTTAPGLCPAPKEPGIAMPVDESVSSSSEVTKRTLRCVIRRVPSPQEIWGR